MTSATDHAATLNTRTGQIVRRSLAMVPVTFESESTPEALPNQPHRGWFARLLSR